MMRPLPSSLTLTAIERSALALPHDFARGHAGYLPLSEYDSIIDGLPMLFRASGTRNYDVSRQLFLEKFDAMSGSTGAADTMLLFSASICIEVAANALRQRGGALGLVSPVFDNIHDIMLRHGMRTIAVSEESLSECKLPSSINGGALFIVMPNNPTGWVLTDTQLDHLAQKCAERNICLIVDSTFRFYADDRLTNLIDICRRDLADWIVIDDTGKTWGASDLKLGLLRSSTSMSSVLGRISEDLLLAVSPFVVSLLTEMLELDLTRGSIPSVALTQANYTFLSEQLHSLPGAMTIGRPTSVSLVQIPGTEMSGYELADALSREGVGVLPADPFYWFGPPPPSTVRVALNRPRPEFEAGVTAMLAGLARVTAP